MSAIEQLSKVSQFKSAEQVPGGNQSSGLRSNTGFNPFMDNAGIISNPETSVSEGAGVFSLMKRAANVVMDWFSALIGSVEDPVLRIERRIEELQEEIPELDHMAAVALGEVGTQQNKVALLQASVDEARDGARVAKKAGNQGLLKHWGAAGGKATRQLKNAEANLAKIELQAAEARRAVGAAKNEIDRQVESMKGKVSDAKFAKVFNRVAGKLDKLQIGGRGLGKEMAELDKDIETKKAHFKITMENNNAVAKYDTQVLQDEDAADDFLNSIDE